MPFDTSTVLSAGKLRVDGGKMVKNWYFFVFFVIFL